MDEDDIRISNGSGFFDSSMDQFLNDKFGKPEAQQADNSSGFDDFLACRFPRTSGPIEREINLQEYFAAIKKRRLSP